MTIAYAIVAALIAVMVAAQLLGDPDPELTAAIRGRYVRTVELIAVTLGALPIVLAVAFSWAVEQLGEHGRQMGDLRAGVAPWHA